MSADFPEIEMLCGFLAQAAMDNPTMVGHRAAQIGSRTEQVAKNIIFASCKTRKTAKQKKLLDGLITFSNKIESFLQGLAFIYNCLTISFLSLKHLSKFSACKKSGGNPAAFDAHKEVQKTFKSFVQVKEDLSDIIEDNPEQQLFGQTNMITRAMNKVL